MGNTEVELDSLISRPSLESVIYQGMVLRDQLIAIDEEEHPPEACEIRDVLLCLVERICDELQRPNAFDLPSELKKLRELNKNLHELYSFLQYLRASSRQRTPSGIQLALTELTKKFFPGDRGKPICLVLPQWEYNFQFLSISRRLEQMFSIDGIDPRGSLGVRKKEKLPRAVWNSKYRRAKSANKSRPFPNQISILSFAALETDNPLLYPLLAHELGHAIDFSHSPPLFKSHELNAIWKIVTKATPSKSKSKTSPDIHGIKGMAYVCIQECLADLLAARMMGLAYFITQAEYLKSLVKEWPGPHILKSGYPGIKFRLSVTFDHLESLPEAINPFKFLNAHQPKANFLLAFLDAWRRRLKGNVASGISQDQLSTSAGYPLIEDAMKQAIPLLYNIAERVIPNDRCATLSDTFFDRIVNLNYDLPPSCNLEGDKAFSEILSAGWAYQLEYGRSKESKLGAEDRWKTFKKTARLIVKAIELIPVCSSSGRSIGTSLVNEVAAATTAQNGVLGAPSVLNRILRPVDDPSGSAITIIPQGNLSKSLNCISLDLHLGNWFSIARKTRVECFKVGEESSERLLAILAREKTFVPHQKPFIVHPGDFVLGVTLEFIALPGDVMAYVEGKSRIGRMGLIIATASKIDPGFHGVVVLELANAGTVPLQVEPGCVIAQLVFHGLDARLPQKYLYRKDYYCQTQL